MLRCKGIKVPCEPEDGLRISIMIRHTLDDGVTPDPEITPDLYDEWWKELAPPPTLVGAYLRGKIAWTDYTIGYLDHLGHEPQIRKLRELIDLAKEQNVTVLCVEEIPDHCHRRLLVMQCLVLDPTLEYEIH